MMCTSGIRQWAIGILFAFALFNPPPAGGATPANWKDTAFAINADNMKLSDVLEEFGRVYGVRVVLSARADEVVSGRVKADSGSAFLDRLAQPHRFSWFVYNDTLYVVPRDDNTSLRIEVGEDSVQDAKAALVGLGLFDSRFGWGEFADEGLVIVSGPRAYVALVRETLLPEDGDRGAVREAKATIKGRQIMLFKLKYASATDRVISSRGQSETVPGVKTILTSLLLGQRDAGEKLARTGEQFDVGSFRRSRTGKHGAGSMRETDDKPADAAKGSANARRDAEESDESRKNRRKSGSGREDDPRIEADASLNAIIIYDKPSKREMYRALIAELDIEPQQVEIEALIVDIDRSQLAELGVEWGIRSGNTSAAGNAGTADSQGVALPLPGATLLISNAARFYARLKLLEGAGLAQVLAKPTVLTLDNVAAVLDLSQTSYVPLIGERVADLADVTAGTKLRVVPRIVREGSNVRVRLEVDIEDGTLGDPKNPTSIVTRSTISTQAIINAHQSLMIGGYHAESVTSNKQKMPGLGDLPLVGNLFRSESTTRNTRERLFLITPRLSGPAGAPATVNSRTADAARDALQRDAAARFSSADADAAPGTSFAAAATHVERLKPASQSDRTIAPRGLAAVSYAPDSSAPAAVPFSLRMSEYIGWNAGPPKPACCDEKKKLKIDNARYRVIRLRL